MRIGRFFSSIRVRMVVIYLVVTAAAFVATSAIVSYLMEDFLVSQRTQQQSEQVSRLALELARIMEQDDPQFIYETIAERAQELDGRVLVLDTDAVVQADSSSQYNGYYLPYREVRDVLIGGKETSYGFHSIVRTEGADSGNPFSISRTYSIWTVYYTAPILRDGQIRGAVVYSVLIQDVMDSVNTMLQRIAMIFIGVAVVIAIISFILSGWLTKPILVLTNAIRRMGRRGGGVRVNVKGKGELAELVDAFNRMSQQIEDHDRVRDEFVSNASHELKTPLSTMKILSESILYQQEPDAGMMKEFFLDVNHEVDRLTDIINDLLRLVREEAGESETEFERVPLDELVRAVVTRLAPLARKKGIRLEMRIAPVAILGNGARLEQVFTNLIDNAIKYTDEGSVQVMVRADGDTAVFAVKDTGIGISGEAQARLFERFYRVDRARSRETGGTGLGLSIVERIVHNHGGYIKVESALNKGSTFTVYLPLERGGDAR
ncbi:MAG: HAMP domain-containing sensor histidine kinase [Bacillota bacterium]